MSHTTDTTDTTAPKRPAPRSSLSWRVNEIVIAAVIAVACAIIFWIWDIAVSPAAKTALVAAPELRPLIAGAWLLGGTLGGLLIPALPSSASSLRRSSRCCSPAVRGAARF